MQKLAFKQCIHIGLMYSTVKANTPTCKVIAHKSALSTSDYDLDIYIKPGCKPECKLAL